MAKIFELAFQIGGKLGSSFSGAFTSAKGALATLGQQAKNLERGQADISRFRGLKMDASETAKRLAAAQSECSRLASTIRSTENPTRKLQNEFDAAKRKAGELKDKLAGQNQELHQVRSSMRAAGIATSGLAASQSRLAKMADTARVAQSRLQSVLAKQQANQANRERMGGAMMSGMGGTVVGGIAAGFAADKLMTPGIDLEHLIAQGRVIGDMSREQAGKSETAIREAARSGNQEILKTAEAWKTLLAGGMDQGKASAIMGDITKSTTATGAEINDVALAANTLSQNMKILPEDMKKSFEIMHFAGKEGMFEFKDMAKDFPRLTGHFKLLGIEGPRGVANLAASLQVARRVTGDSSQAATNMENFLQKMSSPETVKKFEENYGINVEKAVKKAMKRGEDPMMFMLGMIKRVTGGDKFRIGELFQDQQVGNFLAAVIPDLKELQDLSDRALKAGGVIDKDFLVMMEAAKEQMKGVSVSASDLAISIGKSLSPAFTNLLSGIKPVINFANNIATAFPKATAVILSLSGAGIGLGVALSVVGFLGTYAVGGVLALQKAFLVLRAATISLNFAFLANPITWIAAAFVAAAYAVYTYWGPISGFFKGLFLGISVTVEPLMSVFRKMGGWFSWVIEPVKELFGWLGRLLEPADSANAAWFNFGTRLGMMIGNFISSITELPGKISELSQSFFDSGASLITTFADGITSKASAAWEAVKGVFASISDLFPHSDAKTGPLSALTASGRAIIETMASGLTSIGGGPLAAALGAALGTARDAAGQGVDLPFTPGGWLGSARGGQAPITVNFSPVINLQGDAGQGSLEGPLRESEERLRRMIAQILTEDRRISYA